MKYSRKKKDSEMRKVLIGWEEESLVPDKKISIPGWFYERISDRVKTVTQVMKAEIYW